MVLVQIYVFSAMPATIYHDPFRVIQEAEQVSTEISTGPVIIFGVIRITFR
ncbi:hypothetical protein [Oenococcus oeni]|uniref:hypothetical protein n=1 Tax=Oenococcus oeni TaxID=1247 RepID=UPI001FAA9DAB|nr:hypothetical protein [Oenococcus oeni]